MKLSLRELLLLVVIVAMGCGWWVDRTTAVMQERRQVKRLELIRTQQIEALKESIRSRQPGSADVSPENEQSSPK